MTNPEANLDKVTPEAVEELYQQFKPVYNSIVQGDGVAGAKIQSFDDGGVTVETFNGPMLHAALRIDPIRSADKLLGGFKIMHQQHRSTGGVASNVTYILPGKDGQALESAVDYAKFGHPNDPDQIQQPLTRQGLKMLQDIHAQLSERLGSARRAPQQKHSWFGALASSFVKK
ncbi:MAG: hypothetical protein ABIR37_00130 [Candidatus Saccharimonadales bacterium]